MSASDVAPNTSHSHEARQEPRSRGFPAKRASAQIPETPYAFRWDSADSVGISLTSGFGAGSFGHMARMARIVVLGQPQDIIQRGKPRKQIFFSDGDDAA